MKFCVNCQPFFCLVLHISKISVGTAFCFIMSWWNNHATQQSNNDFAKNEILKLKIYLQGLKKIQDTLRLYTGQLQMGWMSCVLKCWCLLLLFQLAASLTVMIKMQLIWQDWMTMGNWKYTSMIFLWVLWEYLE